MRTVTLFIAMSLDGYIADEQGGITWLEETSKGCMAGYDTFYQGIDTIIMGKNTYDQIATTLFDTWPYGDRMTYVLTHESIPDQHNIHFVNSSLSSLLATLQARNGNGIWICGGSNIIAQAVHENLIDRFWITGMPILLGKGIPLFQLQEESSNLNLIKETSYGNMIDLIYERKR